MLPLTALLLASGFPAAQLPNRIFIMAADRGWRDLGCFSSTLYQTPNLDKLAARGVKFKVNPGGKKGAPK